MNTLTRKSVADVTRRQGRTLLAILGIMIGVLGVTAVNEAGDQLGGAFFYSTDPSAVPNIVIGVDRLSPRLAQTARHLPHVQRMQLRTAYSTSWQYAGSTAAHTMEVFAYANPQHVNLWPFQLTAGRLPGHGEIVLDARNRITGYPGGIGDTISLTASNGRMIRLRVVGISRTQGFALGGIFDNPIGYMSQDGLRQITTRSPIETAPTVQILLKTPDASVLQTYRTATHLLQAAHRSIDPKSSDWRYSSGNADTRLSVTGPLTIIRLHSFLALLLVCAMIFNSVTTLLTEQIKIIGTMKALGGTRWALVRSYLVTVGIYSAAGTLIGLTLGLAAGYQLAGHLASTVQLDTGQLMDAGPFQVSPTVVLTSIAVGLLVPQFSALWPLWTGTRITVHEAVGAYGVRSGGSRVHIWGRQQTWVPQTVWLGLRGLFRKPARVSLTLLALILSGAIFVGVQITDDSLGSLLTEQQSPIVRPDIRVDLGDRSHRAIATIRSFPNVERVVPVAFADAVLHQHRVFVTGVSPNQYRPPLAAGRWLHAHEQSAVVLNAVAARTLHLHLGEQVLVPLDIRTPSGQGEVRQVRWTLVGLTHALDYLSGSADPNGSLGEAFTALDTLNRVMRNPPDYADRLSVYAHDRSPRALRQLRDRIQGALDRGGYQGADARTWQDLSQGFVDPLPTIYSLFNAVVILIALVGLLSLALTLAASVVERRLEIGILRSLGATSRRVMTVFGIEALTLALIAWAFAAVVGLPEGILIVQLLGRFLGPFDVSFHPLLIPTMLVFVATIALLASFGPALHAARVLIRETLRYE